MKSVVLAIPPEVSVQRSFRPLGETVAELLVTTPDSLRSVPSGAIEKWLVASLPAPREA
jgi:hypothetical protein